MRSIEPVLTKDLAKNCGDRPVWRAPALEIFTYRTLVEQVAQLAYRNGDQLLFYRGQDADYESKAGGTTLYPAIYRGDYLPRRELEYRFKRLEHASRLLKEAFRKNSIDGFKDVSRKQLIQWSLLQHYEVVPTPLLDVTQSIRVACSFAQIANTSDHCYVYVLGLPYLTNRISINSEHDLVNVRLLSICPPAALRPYFQEGFVAGTADVTSNYTMKTELDFRNRLIAKFRIPGGSRFWGPGFEMIPKSALYPTGDDIKALCDQLREEVDIDLEPGDLGEFIKQWAEIEEKLLNWARQVSERNLSLREAIHDLGQRKLLTPDVVESLDKLRRVRNVAVHTPKALPSGTLSEAMQQLRKAAKAVPGSAA
jgi:hypothetical protein